MKLKRWLVTGSASVIRVLDLVFSVAALIALSPILLLVLVVVSADGGQPIFVQRRMGRRMLQFNIYKFRTMEINTPTAPTHEITRDRVSRTGRLLRRTKVDELPQLVNVLLGDMSLIGPRPCLPSQETVIDSRQRRGVFNVRPGVSGLAQILGVDMSTPDRLARLDARMIQKLDLCCYLNLIRLTLTGRGRGDRIRL